MDVTQGRRYKSRKQRPCDACRRRKICCVREPNDAACSLCKMQKLPCQYESMPNPRRRGQIDVGPSKGKGFEVPNSFHTGRSVKKGSQQDRPEWIYQFVGLSGDQDPFVLRHCQFNGSKYYRGSDWACYRVQGEHIGTVPLHFTVIPDSHLDARPVYYPSANCISAAEPHKAALLRSYFDFVHTSFPLLEAARLQARPDDTLLAVMYELALPFCNGVPAHVRKQDFLSFASQALPINARSPRFEVIEAALLFLQRHTKVHRAPTTPGIWSEIGSLVGMAHDAGLNVDPTSWDISKSDRDRRIRMWWAVYIYDKWLSLGLGRPSYIHDEDCNVPLLAQGNIPTRTYQGGTLPQISAAVFVAMAALTAILSDALKAFYTMKAIEQIKKLDANALTDLTVSFDERLTAFHNGHLLPLCLLQTDEMPDPTGTVFLAFYTVGIIVNRAILRCLGPGDAIYPKIRAQARKSIDSVTTLLESLQETRLRAFWWSRGFMFSLLLTSTDDAEIDYWTTQIARYKRLLELRSLTFDTTKLAATRMRLLGTMSQSIDLAKGSESEGRPWRTIWLGL
ncbi:hypothetical protein K490DRAFT_41715 [Saccharata proteae CBS 121410]|uniref:Zn(2)-C6 fungal-type domain-containing protein n=1 Tax=Saccharata proteae CBS 121410 TaxID=1314787 RepID=A0A9P4HVM1_9PEZI|nr:hypothetical protein K490DRAFT_41715 [Saccharata proteae CBS 121410]